jgi:hypothetical protein
MTARNQLMDMIHSADCYTKSQAELVPLQLEAARELIEERRAQLPILDRRIRETGVGRIEKLDELIPLLFSHTTYKSYPASFIQKGQWDRMTKWLSTLTTGSMEDVDLENIIDIDDWVSRLWNAGHLVNTTSGTSGKVSFLNRTQGDDDFFRETLSLSTCWPEPIKPERKHHFFFMGPRKGPYLLLISANIAADLFGRHDSLNYLTNETLKLTDITRMAEMRLKMADGSATPGDIVAFEESGAEQSARMAERFEAMVSKIIELRREPIFLTGGWSQLWQLMQIARERGIGDGEFHHDSVIQSGGGLKGADLPPDYREQLFAFFGPLRTMQGYGMSEMSRGFPMDEAGNYHQAPWIIPFVLDAEGVKPAGPREGVVEGRFAYLDLSNEARWNGLISGDRVTIDFREERGFGQKGLVVEPDISRYANIGEEDKIGCAGTIDSYIRGAMAQ